MLPSSEDARELVAQRLYDLDRRIVELSALRNELRGLLSEWDAKLAQTPHGRRAHLLETLGGMTTIERGRRTRTARTAQFT
jgi:hypothetical protein